MQHKAFVTEMIYPDSDATEDHWAHLMRYPVFFKIQKDRNVSALIDKGGNIGLASEQQSVALQSRSSLTIAAVSSRRSGTQSAKSPLERPLKVIRYGRVAKAFIA